MTRTMAEYNEDKRVEYGTKNNLFTDFPKGTRVQVITGTVDFYFFDNDVGTVTKNTGNYLGITVKFDKLMKIKDNDGKIRDKKSHNFAPTDLIKIDTSKAVLNYCPHCGHKLPHDEL